MEPTRIYLWQALFYILQLFIRFIVINLLSFGYLFVASYINAIANHRFITIHRLIHAVMALLIAWLLLIQSLQVSAFITQMDRLYRWIRPDTNSAIVTDHVPSIPMQDHLVVTEKMREDHEEKMKCLRDEFTLKIVTTLNKFA